MPRLSHIFTALGMQGRCLWLHDVRRARACQAAARMLSSLRHLQVRRVPIPPAPPRATQQQRAVDNAPAYGNCGIHSIGISPDRSLSLMRISKELPCTLADSCLCAISDAGYPWL